MPIIRLLALLLLILPVLSPAFAATASLPIIDAARVTDQLPLHEQLSTLSDPGASRDIVDIMASPDWRPISAASIAGGYSGAAIWLRGTLSNSSDLTVTRWLVVGSPRLEHVDFYRLDKNHGQVLEAIHSGTALPLAQRPVASLLPLFPVTLSPGDRIDFAVRIETRSALNLTTTLWEPSAFRENEGRELAIHTTLFSLPILLALYALMQGIVWRDRSFFVIALWIITTTLYVSAFEGYLYRFLLTDGGSVILRAPATIASLCALVYAWLTCIMIGVHRIPFWKHAYRLLALLMLAVSFWTAFGNYRAAAPVSNAVIGLFCPIWIASVLHAWRRGFDNARLFLISFGFAWIVICIRLLEIGGFLPHNMLPGLPFPRPFQSALLPMMALIVITHSMELYRKHERVRQTLLDTQAQEHIRLEQAVTERTQALRDALLAADEANHAKSDFLTRISHDLRTPLTSILGFADMVQTSGGDNAARGRIIRRSARHMLTMINDLIDYARGEQGDALQPVPVYAHALIHTVAHEGTELARRNRNRFGLHISPKLPPVLLLDAKRLHRILANLLDNAAKYTTDGSIMLSVECTPATSGEKTVLLEFRIKDTGCGIAPEHQVRVFQPFERADTSLTRPGIGLGLAIVRQWTQRMGGTITMESDVGMGTLVTLMLPADIDDEHNISRHHVLEDTAMKPLIDGANKLIWVVEDSPDIGQLLNDQLSSLGFSVRLLPDSATAIACMKQPDGPPPALVLTDYLMPDANGDQVLQAARHCLPGVPVLLLSATPQPIRDDGVQPARFDASLLKPINFLELQNAITRLLGLDHTGSDVSSAIKTEPPLLPPEELLQRAHSLIALGAISDLLDWIDDMDTHYPQYESFSHQARRLITQGNLIGLSRLCRH